jgi:hypothetical protein
LQAARATVEAELQMALAVAECEAAKAKAHEAKKVIVILRKRGSEIDAGLRKLLEDYTAIQADMAALSNLGATRINSELVKANCRRAMRSALIPIRSDLEMPLVPPLERRTFSELVGAWAGTAERMIEAILKQPDATVAPAEPSSKQARRGR